MHSPLPSPSTPLRAMAYAHSTHAHPHLPRSSYFSPVLQAPPVPGGTRYPIHPTSYPAKPAHPPSAYASHPPPTSPRLASSPARPLMPARRNSFRESAIPLRPANVGSNRPPNALPATSETESGRRRPSFKIDLPPRPIPVEILHSVHTSIHTPYPVKGDRQASLAQKTANNTALNAHTPPAHYHAAESGSNLHAALGHGHKSTFRDPFAHGDEYIILQPSPDLEALGHPAYGTDVGRGGYSHEPVSPMADQWSGAGIVGLGYTLNKLRAPTPWVRGKADEGEWLTASDVDEVECRTGRMSMA